MTAFPRWAMLTAVTRILLSWSGGKDSALTLARLLADSTVQVVGLLTSVSSEFDRISIHGVRRSILHRQAQSLRLPLIEVELTSAPTNAMYERAFADGLARAKSVYPGIDTVAFGDLFLEDVRQYREQLAGRLGWKRLYPLWGEPTRALAERFIDEGFRAYLTCVDTTQLDASFAGRLFDEALLRDLPPSADPCGERGEFHTCVVAGPLFAEAIEIRPGDRVLRDGRFQYCDLVEV